MHMRSRTLLVLAALLALAGSESGASSKPCQDLAACIRELRELGKQENKYGGMGPESDRLKRQVLAFPGAVDALVPLLEDPNERVADLAAYALRDAAAIDPVHLPKIRKGLDRKLGWLAPALAGIGTEEAAREAVDRFLVSDSAPHNQEAFAVERFGRRAIPVIVERARCRTPCKDDVHYLLGAVLSGMGPERADAGPGLLGIATDRSASPQAARGALLMIAKLGADGSALEADLLRERERAPYLSRWIDEALVGIHSQAAGAIFAQRLVDEPNAIALRDLAEIGKAGRDAGPAVMAILERAPGLRPEAIKTLGYIGYQPAVPALVAALDDPVDVRVALASTAALGRLQATDALAALDRTASQHWYPPVRDAARQAASRIRTGANELARPREDNFAMEYFSDLADPDGLPTCKNHREAAVDEPAGTKLYARTSSRQLKRLSYASEVVSYGASDEAEQKAAGAKIIEVNPGNLMEHRQQIRQVPDVALRVEGGWLAGSSRGEWGGELVFIGDDGSSQRILDENVEDIFRLGTRLVATTGLAHLSMNNGALVELKKGADGRWTADTWRILPGAPAASFLVKPDGLLVKTMGRGAIVVNADGGMRMANCAP